MEDNSRQNDTTHTLSYPRSWVLGGYDNEEEILEMGMNNATSGYLLFDENEAQHVFDEEARNIRTNEDNEEDESEEEAGPVWNTEERMGYAQALQAADEGQHGCESHIRNFMENNIDLIQGSADFLNREGLVCFFGRQDNKREETLYTDSLLSDLGDIQITRSVCFKFSRMDIARYIRKQQYTYLRLADTTRIRLFWLGTVYKQIQSMLTACCLRSEYQTDCATEESGFLVPRCKFEGMLMMSENEVRLFTEWSSSNARRITPLNSTTSTHHDVWHHSNTCFTQAHLNLLGKNLNFIPKRGDKTSAFEDDAYWGFVDIHAVQIKNFPAEIMDDRLSLRMPRNAKDRKGKRHADIAAIIQRRYLLATGVMHSLLTDSLVGTPPGRNLNNLFN